MANECTLDSFDKRGIITFYTSDILIASQKDADIFKVSIHPRGVISNILTDILVVLQRDKRRIWRIWRNEVHAYSSWTFNPLRA